MTILSSLTPCLRRISCMPSMDSLTYLGNFIGTYPDSLVLVSRCRYLESSILNSRVEESFSCFNLSSSSFPNLGKWLHLLFLQQGYLSLAKAFTKERNFSIYLDLKKVRVYECNLCVCKKCPTFTGDLTLFSCGPSVFVDYLTLDLSSFHYDRENSYKLFRKLELNMDLDEFVLDRHIDKLLMETDLSKLTYQPYEAAKKYLLSLSECLADEEELFMRLTVCGCGDCDVYANLYWCSEGNTTHVEIGFSDDLECLFVVTLENCPSPKKSDHLWAVKYLNNVEYSGSSPNYLHIVVPTNPNIKLLMDEVGISEPDFLGLFGKGRKIRKCDYNKKYGLRSMMFFVETYNTYLAVDNTPKIRWHTYKNPCTANRARVFSKKFDFSWENDVLPPEVDINQLYLDTLSEQPDIDVLSEALELVHVKKAKPLELEEIALDADLLAQFDKLREIQKDMEPCVTVNAPLVRVKEGEKVTYVPPKEPMRTNELILEKYIDHQHDCYMKEVPHNNIFNEFQRCDASMGHYIGRKAPNPYNCPGKTCVLIDKEKLRDTEDKIKDILEENSDVGDMRKKKNRVKRMHHQEEYLKNVEEAEMKLKVSIRNQICNLSRGLPAREEIVNSTAIVTPKMSFIRKKISNYLRDYFLPIFKAQLEYSPIGASIDQSFRIHQRRKGFVVGVSTDYNVNVLSRTIFSEFIKKDGFVHDVKRILEKADVDYLKDCPMHFARVIGSSLYKKLMRRVNSSVARAKLSLIPITDLPALLSSALGGSKAAPILKKELGMKASHYRKTVSALIS